MSQIQHLKISLDLLDVKILKNKIINILEINYIHIIFFIKGEFTFERLGIRVPAIAISPWMKKGVETM